jgi:NADPH-dependent glutamate synthase beta subunit-like oxidoreductase
MLRMAIPDYRLPKDILDADIDEIVKSGVKIKTNSEVYNVDTCSKTATMPFRGNRSAK